MLESNWCCVSDCWWAVRSERMAVSVCSIETTTSKHDDEFDDFEFPDLSVFLQTLVHDVRFMDQGL